MVHKYAQRHKVDRLCEILLETRRSRGARKILFVVGHTALFGKALAHATQEVQARHPRHGEMSLMINVGRYSLPRTSARGPFLWRDRPPARPGTASSYVDEPGGGRSSRAGAAG